MIKTIYIGLVPQEYLNMGTEDLIVYNDNYYYYKLDFDMADGCATLTDTCGRYMPLDMTNYGEISRALDCVANYQNQYNDLQEDMDEFLQGVPSFMRTVEVDEYSLP